MPNEVKDFAALGKALHRVESERLDFDGFSTNVVSTGDKFGLLRTRGGNPVITPLGSNSVAAEFIPPFDMVEDSYTARTFYPETRLFSFDGTVSLPVKPIKTMRFKAGRKPFTMSFSRDYQNDNNLGTRVEDLSQSQSPAATFKQVSAVFREGMDVAISHRLFLFSRKNISSVTFKAAVGWATRSIITITLDHFNLASYLKRPPFRLSSSQTATPKQVEGSGYSGKWLLGTIKQLFVKKELPGDQPVVSITTASPYGIFSSIASKVHSHLDLPSMFRPDAFGVMAGYVHEGDVYADETGAEKIWFVSGQSSYINTQAYGETPYSHRVFAFGESTWDGVNPFPFSIDIRAITSSPQNFWTGFGLNSNYSDGSMVFRFSNKSVFQNGYTNKFGQRVEQHQHLYKRSDKRVERVSFILAPYTQTGSKTYPMTFSINVHQRRFDDFIDRRAEGELSPAEDIGPQIGTFSVTMKQGVKQPMLRATSSMDGKLCRLEIIAFDDVYEWISEYDGKDHNLVFDKKVIELSFSDTPEEPNISFTTTNLQNVWPDLPTFSTLVGIPVVDEPGYTTARRENTSSSVSVHSIGASSTDYDYYNMTANWTLVEEYEYETDVPYGASGFSPGEYRRTTAYVPTETGFLSHEIGLTLIATGSIAYSHRYDAETSFYAEALVSVPHGSPPPQVVWPADPYDSPLTPIPTVLFAHSKRVYTASAPAVSASLFIDGFDSADCTFFAEPWSVTRTEEDGVTTYSVVGGNSTTQITANGSTVRTIVRGPSGVISDSNPNNDPFWNGSGFDVVYVPAGNITGVYATPWNTGFGARAQTGYLYNASRVFLEYTRHGMYFNRITTGTKRIRNPRTGALATVSNLGVSYFM